MRKAHALDCPIDDDTDVDAKLHHGCGGGDHSHALVHSHDHSKALEGDPLAKRKLLLAGCLTAAFMAIEVIGGLVSGSLALIADAGHMLTDTAALWLAWYAMHAAERLATQANTFGFHRAKIVVAYTNGLALLVIIAWIAFEAAGRLLTPQPIVSDTMLIVAGLGLVVNMGCLWMLHGGGDGLNMRGARLHVIGDLLGSIAAVVAALIIHFTGWTAADPILSLIMAVILGIGAIRLVRQSLHILLQGTPNDISPSDIQASVIRHVSGVLDVHHVHVWALDDEKPILTLHARIDQSIKPDVAIASIKRFLEETHHVRHSTVEVEFDECADTNRPRTY